MSTASAKVLPRSGLTTVDICPRSREYLMARCRPTQGGGSRLDVDRRKRPHRRTEVQVAKGSPHTRGGNSEPCSCQADHAVCPTRVGVALGHRHGPQRKHARSPRASAWSSGTCVQPGGTVGCGSATPSRFSPVKSNRTGTAPRVRDLTPAGVAPHNGLMWYALVSRPTQTWRRLIPG